LSSTDEQQIAELKAFWEDYGRSAAIGILVALLSIGGWNFWTQYQSKQAEEASAIYYQMLEAYQDLEKTLQNPPKEDEDNSEKSERVSKLAAFQETVGSLKEQYGKSEYAHYARLQNAKYYVVLKDYDSAENELKDVLKNSPNKSIELLTSLRLARVMFANGKADEALKISEANNRAAGYNVAFLELAGDIYAHLGDQQKAFEAYKEAKDLSEQPSETLNMKYFNLLSK
jgi:predicted negative regulator of RcsB-dependent stress response